MAQAPPTARASLCPGACRRARTRRWKNTAGGGAGTRRVLGVPEERCCQCHLLPAHVAADPGGARLTPQSWGEGQVFPPRVCPLPECRHQPSGRRWPRLATSRTSCFFLRFLWPGSNSNMAGNTLAPALAELFFHCPPCRRQHCCRQKPGLLFIKLLKSEALTSWPQDASARAKPRPARMVLLYRSVKGPFACQPIYV